MSTPRTEREDRSWRGRPVLSLLVRFAVYAVPIAVGLVAAQLVVAAAEDRVGRWTAMALTLGTGVGTSWLVTRVTTRLLPLAVLLRMTMLFPDQAPSRLAVARRTTSVGELTQRLASGEADEREAATTLLALVTALGRHDRKTRGHSERVRLFCDLLGEQLGLDDGERGRLRWAALVHDIGKLDVAARILSKPDKLDADEWVSIKAHPAAGAMLAQPLAEWLGPWFAGIAEHHERYDGTGYPLGLKGAEISLAGRAVAVVDAFETMTAARSYKSPVSTWAARTELTACAGGQFDPMMVRAFLQIALPSVLRAVGPLAFVVNVPFLRWVGQSTVRAADVASGTIANTVAAAGVSAVVVAGGGVPSAPIETYAADPRRPVETGLAFGAGADRTGTAAGTSRPGRAEETEAPAAASPAVEPTPSSPARPSQVATGSAALADSSAATPSEGQAQGPAARAVSSPEPSRSKKSKPAKSPHPARPTHAASPTLPPQATTSARPTQAVGSQGPGPSMSGMTPGGHGQGSSGGRSDDGASAPSK